MSSSSNSEPPFACPKLPSHEIQSLVSKCNIITTNSFWLQYYLPQPMRIDSGIGVRLPSALSIQNSSDHNSNNNNTGDTMKKPAHVRQVSSAATRPLEALKFELCLAENLANKPNLNKNKNKESDSAANATDTTAAAATSTAASAANDYDDPFAGLSFESPRESTQTDSSVATKFAAPEAAKKSNDPFAGPFAPGSHICDLDAKYRLLLNKFPVWPNNILVVSKDHIEQSTPLSAGEFDLSYKVLLSCLMNETSANSASTSSNLMNLDCPHLLFLNSGAASGGTLTHRHVQIIYNLSHLPLNIIGSYLKQMRSEREMRQETLKALHNPSMQNSNDFDASALLDAMGSQAAAEKGAAAEASDEKKDAAQDAVETMESVVKGLDLNGVQTDAMSAMNALELYEEVQDGDVRIVRFGGFKFVHAIYLIDSKKWYGMGYDGKTFKKIYDTLIAHVRREAKIKNNEEMSYNLMLNSEMMIVVPRKKSEFEGFRVNALPFAGLLFVTSEEQKEMFKTQGKSYQALKSVTF